MKYRSEIDGLRAFAVVPVILFHAGYELFSGGFVGVDVFFVISGYLITMIIIDELEHNQFSIAKFYERRARRIFPALFFVILTSCIVALNLMTPMDMKDFSQSVVATITFVSNILYWHESGYFERASEFKPLMHTWSLAVEEQFYVIFPLALLLLWRFGFHTITIIVVGLIFLSLYASIYFIYKYPNAVFFYCQQEHGNCLLAQCAL
jgi:peptidoglycan/LPS O-acetylase OafA/YrhL